MDLGHRFSISRHVYINSEWFPLEMMPRLKAKTFNLSFVVAKNLVSLLFLYVQKPVFTFNLVFKKCVED